MNLRPLPSPGRPGSKTSIQVNMSVSRWDDLQAFADELKGLKA